MAAELVARDPSLWLSRSWTTRQPRPGEQERKAYVFVDRTTFEEAIEAGGVFEWAPFLDYLQGTPIPNPPAGSDVLLEIDVQGAEQVLAKRPDATVIMLLPPSAEVQAARLAARGDSEEHIRKRVELGVSEVAHGAEIAAHTVVNDDLGRALAELGGIIDATRSAAPCAENPEES
jgi:guanylate kinase